MYTFITIMLAILVLFILLTINKINTVLSTQLNLIDVIGRLQNNIDEFVKNDIEVNKNFTELFKLNNTTIQEYNGAIRDLISLNEKQYETLVDSIKVVGNDTTQNIAKLNEDLVNVINKANNDITKNTYDNVHDVRGIVLSVTKDIIDAVKVNKTEVVKKIEAKNSSLNRIIKNYLCADDESKQK